MNIAVIAANGRLGKIFVETALAAGHTVRAGIRGPNTLVPHDRLTAVLCDATKTDDLRTLLLGQDVVVSAIGHVKGVESNVQTLAAQAIIEVMHELRITRYVDVTGTGVRLPGDKITLIDRVLNLAVTLVDKDRVQDGIDHQAVLEKSDLDWTTIRLLKLQNVEEKPFLLTSHGPTKSYVGRHEVAKAMLQVIEENAFLRQAPIISSPSSNK